MKVNFESKTKLYILILFIFIMGIFAHIFYLKIIPLITDTYYERLAQKDDICYDSDYPLQSKYQDGQIFCSKIDYKRATDIEKERVIKK